jgi:hypothetical protein
VEAGFLATWPERALDYSRDSPHLARIQPPYGVVLMALSDFQVVHERGAAGPSFDDPLIHSFDGQQLVLAFVGRTALNDYFRVPGSERRTLQQWNLVVESNLDAFAGIIAGKYESGRRSTYRSAAGQSFPRVDVTLADMEEYGRKFSDDVLKLNASFQ